MNLANFLGASRVTRNTGPHKVAKTAQSPSNNTIQYKKMELMIKHENDIEKQRQAMQEKEAKKSEIIDKLTKSQRKSFQLRNSIKEEKINKRLEEIEQNNENHADQVYEEMQRKQQRAIEIVEENRSRILQKLQDRDLNYAQKQEKALKHIKSLDESEFQKSMHTLDKLEDRQMKSEKLHERMLNKRVNNMRNKNIKSFRKLQEYKSKKEQEYEQKVAGVLQKEEKDMKRLERIENAKVRSSTPSPQTP